MSVYHPDGTPSPLLGWQGDDLDFEVYNVPDAKGRQWRSYEAYWRDELFARRYARTRLGLYLSMWLTRRRWLRARGVA